MTVRWIILCEPIECLGCRPDGLQASQTMVAYATKGRGAPPAPLYESSSENSDSEVMVPATPPRPAGKAQLAEESQGGTTITLALRTPGQLRLGPDLIPRVSPPRESEPAWQLPASTAPPSLGQADARPKRKHQGTIKHN